MSTPDASAVCEEDRRAASAHFDHGFYLAANPDVREAGMDPLAHFLAVGWREGRNPSPSFDVGHYLAENGDVAAAGVNPLLHYVRAGAREGRRPRRPLDAWRRRLDAAVPLRSRVAGWGSDGVPLPTLHASALERALYARGGGGLVVSFSHDDYVRNYGGVQLLIGDEQGAFGAAACSYLHVSPAAPLPLLADPTAAEAFRVGLRFDGDWLGVATFADLLRALKASLAHGETVECVVHHLMGHAPELILDLIRAVGAETPVVWVHDFFTLCPSYALMRNDIAFCGGPPADSAACGLCCYGDERPSHLARVRAFFEAARPAVLAPSALALDHWRRMGDLPHAGAEALAPAWLFTSPSELPGPGDERPLRVAHLGARAFHKGWPVFEELALRFAHDGRYAFFQLGSPDGTPLPGSIRNVPVRVDAEHRNAMVEAVAEARIDVVVGWSLWPETFCFAAHEALAGGAFVVARAAAGNIWPAVAANARDQGCSLADEAALFALFEGDGVRARVQASPRSRGALLPGGGTADWLARRWRTGSPSSVLARRREAPAIAPMRGEAPLADTYG